MCKPVQRASFCFHYDLVEIFLASGIVCVENLSHSCLTFIRFHCINPTVSRWCSSPRLRSACGCCGRSRGCTSGTRSCGQRCRQNDGGRRLSLARQQKIEYNETNDCKTNVARRFIWVRVASGRRPTVQSRRLINIGSIGVQLPQRFARNESVLTASPSARHAKIHESQRKQQQNEIREKESQRYGEKIKTAKKERR